MTDKTNQAPLLRIEGLNKHFGGLHAVKSVSFKVSPHTIKAVIGPNGAGKTTIFNMLAGYFQPSSGKVFFEDSLITGLKPFQTARRGVLRTFQNLKLCRSLSVLENAALGYHTRGKTGFGSGMLGTPASRKDERRAKDAVMPILEWLKIADLSHKQVENLSFGEQRSVELARALAADPRLLLLDEPAAGLNMHETEELAQRIREIKEQGRTVLLVEHDMSLVMDISDEIIVLNFGQMIAEGLPSDIQKNDEVIRIYLGGGDA